MFRLEWKDFEPVLDWLSQLEPEDRFFLFLHTYQVHSPYRSKPPYYELHDPDYDGPVSNKWKDGEWYEKIKSLGRLSERDVAYLVSLLDGTLRYPDEMLARFFNVLKEMNLFGDARTVLIITSDHGEEFLEHGQLTHRQLNQEIMEVPLIFH